MISLLIKHFIPNASDVTSPAVRQAYGTLCGAVGIVLNLLLFALKFFAGLISGSIAITADAFNNLSDAGASVVTLIGFRLAGQKPDPEHPFGHGRIEYLSGLAVAMVIVLMGFELLKTSLDKILHPQAVEFSLLAAGILVCSICIKGYMYIYNRAIGRKISSAAMNATALDSLSDCGATLAVLLATLVGHFSELLIDGYCGLAVACLILRAGYQAAKDTLSPLLGQAPDPELIQQIETIALSSPTVCGIHDLIVHDYGPGRQMISLHAEVDAAGDLLEIHDEIDNIEVALRTQLGCDATIHMDPIASNDCHTIQMRQQVLQTLRTVDENISIHDFRMVAGPTHTNVIFDAVIPFSSPLSEREAEERIKAAVRTMEGNCFAVVTIDRSYV